MAAETFIAVLDTHYAANLFRLCDEFTKNASRHPSGQDFVAIKKEAYTEATAAVAQLPTDITTSSIVEVLLQQAGKVSGKLVALHEDGGMPEFEKTKTLSYLKREFCFNINETKKFNAGNLPDCIENCWTDTCCTGGKSIHSFS